MCGHEFFVSARRPALYDGVEDVRLGPDVLMHQRVSHPGALGDLSNRDPGRVTSGEELLGGIKNRCGRLLP